MSQHEQRWRQVAYRVFSSEFNQATYTFKKSDEERAPLFTLLPTGAIANRVFVVGTLTETQNVGNEQEYWRGRVVDPVGTFFVYAGQYQPAAMKVLKTVDTPVYVAIPGKPRTYETEEGETNVSLRPEYITIVDEPTRQRWVVETADQTLDRVQSFEDPNNSYAEMASEHYDVSIGTFKDLSIRALENLESN